MVSSSLSAPGTRNEAEAARTEGGNQRKTCQDSVQSVVQRTRAPTRKIICKINIYKLSHRYVPYN